MVFLRKLLFLGFLIVYLIACPVLILYALGYIYNPVSGKLQLTGVLHIKSNPSGADIYLGNRRYEKKTPEIINEIRAGNYILTLRKRGYKPWVQEITIEGGKALAFENVVLMPERWEAKEVSTEQYEELINMGNENLFLVATGKALGNYSIYDVDKGLKPILPEKSKYAEEKVSRIHECFNSNAIIAETGGPSVAETAMEGKPGQSKKYLYLRPWDNEPCAIDMTEMVKNGITSEVWQGNENILMYRHEDCISRIELKERKAEQCFLDKVKGYGTYEGWDYYIDSNDAIIRRNSSNKEETVSTNTFTAQRFFKNSKFYDIDIKDEKTIFFLGTKGDFLINLPPYYIANEGVNGYKFSENKTLLLFWMKATIAAADFSQKEDNVVFHENFRVKQEYQKGRNIKECLWADKKAHILFNDSGEIYLMEIEPQGPSHIELVARTKDNAEIFYDSKERTLFYIDKDTGYLQSMEIIPKQPLIEIPEKLKD